MFVVTLTAVNEDKAIRTEAAPVLSYELGRDGICLIYILSSIFYVNNTCRVCKANPTLRVLRDATPNIQELVSATEKKLAQCETQLK